MEKWIFGMYLERLLEQKGWTAAKLAEASKVSIGNIHYLLKGEASGKKAFPNPSAKTLIAIARALNVNPANLLMAFEGKDPDATDAGIEKEALREALRRIADEI